MKGSKGDKKQTTNPAEATTDSGADWTKFDLASKEPAPVKVTKSNSTQSNNAQKQNKPNNVSAATCLPY